MSTLDMAIKAFLPFSTVVLALAVGLCLLRAILGPRFTDRIIAINLIGTKTIMLICILAVLINEHYLVDVALVYSLISFLAVVVLVNIYLTVHKKKRYEAERQEKLQPEEEGME